MEGRLGHLVAEELRQRLARALFPHFCVVCGREGRLLCEDCLEDVNARMTGVFRCPVCGRQTPFGVACGRCRSRSGLDAAAAASSYGLPAARRLLHCFKYEGLAEAGETAVGLFSRFLERRRRLFDVIFGGAAVLPVPMHFYREARRGFNQAEMLAEAASRALGLRRSPAILRRRFLWTAQARLPSDSPKRRENARGSVYAAAGAVSPRFVVLVDDVMTTGATLSECARVLRRAGARRVTALTLLRG